MEKAFFQNTSFRVLKALLPPTFNQYLVSNMNQGLKV